MLKTLFLSACLLCLCRSAFAQHAETVTLGDTTITISGNVEHPQKVTLSQVLRLQKRDLEITDHDGKTTMYEGVLVSDILTLAGAPAGEKLRGRYLAEFYLKATGADGYGALFALPEVDPTFTDQEILVAYRADGKLLSNRDGPFQIIVPGDKRHGRWVRQVAAISIVGVGK